MARPANPELREKILKAAAAIIENCGPDCVTMRQVAEQVGYSATTLYLYFKDKSAILTASVMAAFEELNESCRLAMVGPTPLDKYRQRCRAYVIWALTHPGHYTLMFQLPWEMCCAVQFTEDTVEPAAQRRREDLAVLREAVQAGELPAETDLESLEYAVESAVHGAVSLSISGRLAASVPESAPDRIASATAVTDDLINALIASRR